MQSLPISRKSSFLAKSPPTRSILISTLAIFGPVCFRSINDFINTFISAYLELNRQKNSPFCPNKAIVDRSIELLSCQEFLVPQPVIQNVRHLFEPSVVKILNRQIKVTGHDMNYFHLKIDPESEIHIQISTELSRRLILKKPGK